MFDNFTAEQKNSSPLSYFMAKTIDCCVSQGFNDVKKVV